LEQDDVSEVLLAYGADPEVLQEYNCVASRARLVRDVVKLRTPYGPLAFKKVYMPDVQLEYVYQVTEHVATYPGLSVPRFIRTRYGDPYVLHRSGNYYVTAWATGREADIRKERHLIQCAGVLATWHQAAAEFRPDTDWKPPGISLVERLKAGRAAVLLLKERVHRQAQPSAFQKLFLAGCDELVDRVADSERTFAEMDFVQVELQSLHQGSMCHGNFTKKNLLFNGTDYTVVHYEAVQPGPNVYELALYLHRYLPSFDWQPDVLQATVAEYERIAGYKAEFRNQLAALIRAPFRALQIASWYLERAVSWEEEDYVDALERAFELDEVRSASANHLCRAVPTFTSVKTSTVHAAVQPKTVHFAAEERLDTVHAVADADAQRSVESATKQAKNNVESAVLEVQSASIRTARAKTRAPSRKLRQTTPRKTREDGGGGPKLWNGAVRKPLQPNGPPPSPALGEGEQGLGGSNKHSGEHDKQEHQDE